MIQIIYFIGGVTSLFVRTAIKNTSLKLQIIIQKIGRIIMKKRQHVRNAGSYIHLQSTLK